MNLLARKGVVGLAVAAAAVAALGAAAAASGSAGAHAKKPKLKHGLLTVTGTQAGETIAIRLRAGDPTVIEVDVDGDGAADFDFKRANVERISVDAGGGDDVVRVDDTNGVFTDAIPTTLDGGDGADTLVGGFGGETLVGGDGNDAVDGNRGNDVALLGAGDDTFTWDPGDGSDTVEGQDGADKMRFNGANVAEHVDLTANGPRLRFTRDVANITMDTAGVEDVDFRALGGADVVTVGDLAGTGVANVNVDLASTAGGGDGAADRVVVTGTAGDDSITPSGSDGRVDVAGLATHVAVVQPEPASDQVAFETLGGADRVTVNGTNGADAIAAAGDATAAAITASGIPAVLVLQNSEATDSLAVNGLDGDDAISAAALVAPVSLTVTGGAGDDTIAGGLGDDRLAGGDGNDFVDGNRGSDVGLLGAGDDTFQWDPGDGSDVVEGQDGADTMRFNGANVGERIDIAANGPRLRFFRDIANITMDTAGVERVDFRALGGSDEVTVHDLSGTGVTSVNVDLAATVGGGDGAADHVIVEGTSGDDVVSVSGGAGSVTAAGLPARVSLTGAEPANDTLTVKTLAGDDVAEASGLAADSVQLTLDGGEGDDVLIGSAGNDTLLGGEGDDVLRGGPGQDVVDGGPGDNILIQD